MGEPRSYILMEQSLSPNQKFTLKEGALIRLKDNSSYHLSFELEQKSDLAFWQNLSSLRLSDFVSLSSSNLFLYPYSLHVNNSNQLSALSKNNLTFEQDSSFNPHLLVQNYLRLAPSQIKLGIRTQNICGFLSYQGQDLSIQSRFTQDQEDYFLHYILSKVLDLNIISLPHTSSNEQVFDFLLLLFPSLLVKALRQGRYKEYQHQFYNDSKIKGTINIAEQIKVNQPFRGKIAYNVREYCYDNHVNELIRHTIEYLKTHKLGQILLKSSLTIQQAVKQIELSTPNYCKDKRNQIIALNLKPLKSAYFFQYIPLQRLCLKILQNDKTKYGHGGHPLQGILFDVAYLWEQYLATLLVSHGFIHPDNRTKLGKLYLDKEGKLVIYPDFYSKQGIILDAKYKVQLYREDKFQMLAYLYRLQGKKGIFIKPNIFDEKSYLEIETYNLLGYGQEEQTKIQVYNLLIPNQVTSYTQFTQAIAESEQKLIEAIKQPI